MADLLIPIDSSLKNFEKYEQQGDGSFAQIVKAIGGTGGGGGASGDVTSAGTNGTLAQAVQGINNGVPVRVNQAGITFTNSTLNTSSAELASGASFVGTWEDTFNQPAAQLLGNSNQPMIYTVDQAIDAAGTYIVSSTKFRRGANEDVCENIQINANYLRVTATNIGLAATTLFELNTTYGPLSVAPQALSNSGNYPVAARETQNFTKKLRDHYQTFPNANTPRVSKAAGDVILADGNAVAASYLVMSLDPLTAGTETYVSTDALYSLPVELGLGVHTSQRTYGQELAASVISDQFQAAPAELTISSIQQATTILTISTTTPHGLRIGDRIGIYGVTQDSRLNLPAVVVATTPSTTQFTVTSGPQGAITSLTVGPFSSGYVYKRDALAWAMNGTSMILENATATNASLYIKAEGGDAMPIGIGTYGGNHSITIGTTASAIAATGALNYAFRPTNQYSISVMADRVQWSDRIVDGIGQTSSRGSVDQICPDPDQFYSLRYSVKNRKSLTIPVAKIVSVSKTGTTTANVTTDVAHGLTTGDYINTYGVRDQTNFANLSSSTLVTSIINATSFTVTWGAAVTATSYGGYVSRVQGSTLQQGAVPQAISTVNRTGNIVTLVGSATWTLLSIGDLVNIYGCRVDGTGADLGIDGVYRVRDQQTTSLFLEAIPTLNAHANNPVTPTGADIVTTNCGGGVLKRTDLRVSFTRLFDYERLRVEPLPRPAADSASAFPVVVQTGTVSVSSGTITSVSQIAASVPLMNTPNGATNKSLGVTITNATANTDQSATAFAGAGRVNGTVVAAANGAGAVISSEINVSALTLGTATSVVAILQESRGGTNFTDIWQSDPITATGIVTSPTLVVAGRRRWCFHSIGGTSTTVTATITTLELFGNYPVVRMFRDVYSATNPLATVYNSATAVASSLVLTTLNSTTASWLIEGMNTLTFFVTLTGAPTVTTQPILSAEFSMDGTNWFATGAVMTAAGNGTYRVNVQNELWKFARVRVSTAAVFSAGSYTISLLGMNARG